ncbi:glycosyltransferase family 2 protein [Desulfolucanica intricata]|uniref:glycosyltransferase family 2 protein n=1 Tax=Desulfolucanica intricata TaxID=1285191 RepID=UPI00083216B1|nr:glycosyltransferase family A protein [Desulfolucanica intricata]
MITAVVPVCNEAQSIQKVLENILKVPVHRIIPVVNGCSDRSFEIIKSFDSSDIYPLFYEKALGIDVPRALGAKKAYDLGSDTVLFIDGDMTGVKVNKLRQLISDITKNKTDLALSNCYPSQYPYSPSSLASFVINVRKQLNSLLNLDYLGTATPSHGPHAVSRKLLETIPLREFAVPPVMLTLAAINHLKICIAAEIPHPELGSPCKDPVHSRRVAETIIGDCLEAMNLYQNKPRERVLNGVKYIGYNQERCREIINKVL